MLTFFNNWIDYVENSRFNPLLKIMMMPGSVFVMISILALTYFLGSPLYLGLVVGALVLILCLYSFWHYEQIHKPPPPAPIMVQQPATDDTAEFPPIRADTEPERFKSRQIVVDDAGNEYLVVRRRSSYKKRVWNKPTRVIETFSCRLDNSPLVDKAFVRKTDFKLLEGASVIHCFTRLHWMQRGPKQIGVILLTILTTGVLIWSQTQIDTVEPVWLALVWILMMLVCGVSYAAVWIPWAYNYLIVTNVRVILVYKPPFGLPGSMASLKIGDILNVETLDQSPAKFIPSFGNLLTKVGLTGYKVLFGDSAAQGDDWFRDGIKYVRFAEAVENIIASTQAEAAAVEKERHTEDMDFQERQAIASEETVKLLQQLVGKSEDSPH